MTAQKVSPEQIAALMKRITVTTEYSEAPTPHVTAKAWLDGSFHLATAISKAVNPAEFRRDLGEEYSTKEALGKAEDKLWELEGYVLYAQQDKGTFKDRVLLEQTELQYKLDALKAFLDKPKPEFVDWQNWDLLGEQYASMCDYNNTLLKRISLFEK